MPGRHSPAGRATPAPRATGRTPGRRVVITGMGAVTALGSTPQTLWQGICAGASGVGPITRWDATPFRTHIAGEVAGFDPTPVIDAKLQRRLDRFAQFAVVAAHGAVGDAGLDMAAEDPERCGCIVGSGSGGLSEIEDAHPRLLADPRRLSPHMITRLLSSSACGQISIDHHLQGPSRAVSSACASGANAIGDALRCIRYGDADVMVCGGSEASITPLSVGGFNVMRALSVRNETPREASRPFAADRDGFVLAEGAGLVVLEEYHHARRRGARIYGELLGYGATSDAHHMTAPCADGAGAARAMKAALRDARVTPDLVDYVNAHGTSTPQGDAAETRALKAVFGPGAGRVQVSSTKSHLGHLMGASGGVELILSVLCLYHGVIPPTINLHAADPDCDLDYVPHTARDYFTKVALSNSFAFGGHNVTLVVGALDGQPVRARAAA